MEQVKITIDGRELVGNKGQTILNIAAENGIEIPNMCYHKELKVYGACGLCVVEAEGMPKLMRSCATTVEKDGMVIHTDTPRVKQARKIALELLMSDHEGDCKGPCVLRCPAHTNVQGYLKKIAEGDDKGAVKIIKEKIPLPASIGRVCPHPCELDCRRNFVEQPLSIAYLKAFAADNDLASGNPYKPECAPDTGKKVAIVGGGPAGLSAAAYLRKAGHAVTVYDAMPEMGGMLRYGIPAYRLPKDLVKKEVDLIADTGVVMKNNIKLGEDITLANLQKENDAVLVAIGAWQSSNVGCPGENVPGVLGGIDFLRAVNEGKLPDIGKSVAVVGGGNTAMDACRTAIRCGAKNVYVIYRRTREEAPADDLEIEEAIEEGVQFKFLTNPAEIIEKDGKVDEIKLQIMELGEPDASGRRKPIPVEGKFETLQVDTVIAAIGQKMRKPDGIDGLPFNWDRGTVTTDPATGATSVEGLFAAGDMTNRGASIAIEAIGEGDRAAVAIDKYLKGQDMKPAEPFYSKREVTKEQYADYERKPRAEMPVRDPDVRKGDFESVIKGFSDEQARSEAKRCLECGCHDYDDCKLIRYANLDPINPDRLKGEKHKCFKEQKLLVIERDQGKCMLCNQCVRMCREVAGQSLLGLLGRGFKTIVQPEFASADALAKCKDCGRCVEACPTGALKLLSK